jgi:hypothetical protein
MPPARKTKNAKKKAFPSGACNIAAENRDVRVE